MIGFIRKDLAMIKSNFKLLAILTIVYLGMSLAGQMDISFILPFMCVMIMISTFSYDEFNNWNAYVVTFPNGRKNSVKAKYIATLLMIVIVTIITTILSFIISYVRTSTIDYINILEMTFGLIFGTLLVQTFMYPIIYKFGIEKGRIAIFIIVFGIVISGGLLSQFIDLSGVLNALSFLENYWVITIIILSVLLTYGSYRISLAIEMKKNF